MGWGRNEERFNRRSSILNKLLKMSRIFIGNDWGEREVNFEEMNRMNKSEERGIKDN